ncbi:MAG: hypothetical protein K6E29_03715 [Cyanobacteria bacterium RUI128]|nr:hypothetical protein [Cyanobacteria bacterium RUI128]
MLCINNAPMSNVQNIKHNVSFGSDNSNRPSGNNSNALRNSLMALAVLSLAGCSDDFEESYTNPYEQQRVEYQAKTDSINSHKTIDGYMQDLGFLQDGNKLGDVDNIYFEDMQGTKHYWVKGDSTKIVGVPNGIQFHGFDIDKDGNKQEYNIKFEKYHKGLVVTKDSLNPDYEEGKIDTIKHVSNNGKVTYRTKPSTPRDTVTYKFNANPDGSYCVQQASGKGIIFYCPVANARKVNGGLLFEGYDWVKETKTDDIQILQNFQNNVALPKNED